ncbi:phosphoenolpyruvate--protein phosphotransferase [Mycoplasmoides pneumoniae]|uniref:Phosphoenolpyruvate-protein phosphotransferase n=3 Tax=Mycoplasmoides pneumoniae TaxID=2104 RepID=A0AAX0SSL2_MYCPM|nr:phosphoenolpyruvate--protein phosphotransferase [Mycoplasmoides pneumoniae]ADK87207.1 phosphoenolpyruvate-protein phosphotransferase [Mycoplasmoides pneumoniae FH]ALA30788.1 phosphoenolpyruvate-protein phosphotransferase [Mycoplasmoides pneumoniae 19294]ALA31891.1 phosphoenolpyruvate-protein phosphotransferase [Mycoplasmoides pneumoniae 39443]ALA36122.1 phosphoenolpyruvate-protein phosphotransferase [Mycoplasmoides pneumoniae FH]ALA37543.1 phosphoenolpyruvate-protein phosphotransferase [Myc
MKKLSGIGVSDGMALAKAFLVKTPEFAVNKYLKHQLTKAQAKRLLDSAFKKAVKDLEEIKEITVNNINTEAGMIFDAHIQILNDPTITEQLEQQLAQNVHPVIAVDTVFSQTATMFSQMQDKYFQERAADILDLRQRLLAYLTGQKPHDLVKIKSDVIIVAHDLTPSQTATLNKKYVKGFLTEIGGRTSHAAIMARSLEIPAVVGIKGITTKVKDGQIVGVDGRKGIAGLDLNSKDTTEWKKQKALEEKYQQELKQYTNKETVTLDGHAVVVAANIGNVKDMELACQYNTNGVGLFRTEFLYMNSQEWPDEETQYQAYKAVLEQAHGDLVIIRTLDIGGDKKLNYYEFPHEDNPFLGYRALRLTLDKQDIFKTQLRALLRAADHGQLGIMFPMVATLDELLQAKQLLNQVHQELGGNKQFKLGIMIEIPAAVLAANTLSHHVDFFSIGTNDLIQYSFAADRMNKNVSYLYQPLNPALLKLIYLTIEGGKVNDIWTGMCGEMAGEPLAIPLLLGLGLKEFSMSASSMFKARMIIAKLNYTECQTLAQKALTLANAKEVEKLVEKFFKKKDIFI